MTQKTKDIIAIILILMVVVELFIYKSDFNDAFSNIYVITIVNLVLLIGFIFWNSKKFGLRVLLVLITISTGFTILFFEYISDFSGIEKQHHSWTIGNHEIIYTTQEYFAGPGSEPYLKLRKTYYFDLLYKDIDETKTNSTFFKLGKTDCVVKFNKTKTEFDLCRKIQLK